MSLWAKVRGLPIIGLAAGGTLLALILPFSVIAATPSPAGATLAAACLLALAVPVAVGWGCSRADLRLEAVSTQPVRTLDLALALVAVGLTAGLGVVLEQIGVAPAGIIAARAELVFLGLLLLGAPLGWRLATFVPAIYLLAVLVVGGGEDIVHPALWAWIAALPGDTISWILTGTVLGIGLVTYLVWPPGLASGGAAGDA
jgi:hypothetical protein